MTPLSRSLSPQFATVAALFRLAAVERRPEDQPDGYWWVAEIGMTPNPSDPASHRSVNPRTAKEGEALLNRLQAVLDREVEVWQAETQATSVALSVRAMSLWFRTSKAVAL